MAAKNKAIVNKANAAFADNNVEGFLALCANDVEWTMVGDRTVKGKDGIREFMTSMPMQPPTFTVSDVIAEGDFVMAHGDMRMDENGRKAVTLFALRHLPLPRQPDRSAAIIRDQDGRQCVPHRRRSRASGCEITTKYGSGRASRVGQPASAFATGLETARGDTATITSVDLMMAMASSPRRSFRACTASP